MRKLVECVPNFSEGRRPEIVEAIVDQIREVAGVFLLDKELDADHNRSVVTIVGEPEAAKEAAFRMIKKAAELIDLNLHHGEHPRMGATDVVPFIPLEQMTMDECVQLARELGQRVGDELQIPVYLYEEAASRPDRKNLAAIRKGQFEGLRAEIGTNPERSPDYGPQRIHSTAGAVAIGARFFLVAYNVNLDTQDVALAKEIARKIRESSGGFPCVKAMGFELADRKIVQVSMNMVNYTETSLAAVYQAIAEEAQKAGVHVLESEIVGLIPHKALTDTAVELLKIQGFSNDQIIEQRVAQVIGKQGSHDDFLESLASAAPAPGGGSASAMAGTLAAALATMVCHLTIGKKKYQEVSDEFIAVREKTRQLQIRLHELVTEDTRAFESVMAAFALPKTSAEEQALRQLAIQDALKQAVNNPLEVIHHALEVLRLTELVAAKGNRNAITDIGCAVHLANAAIAGAILNVRINLNSLKDKEFITRTEKEIIRLQQTAEEYVQKALNIVESRM